MSGGEDVADAARFAKAQGFAAQGIVEVGGVDAAGLGGERDEREQVSGLADDFAAAGAAQQPAGG